VKLISIITINYNDNIGLIKTINSVGHRKNNDVEYVVIDGNSSDGSQEAIQNNTHYIDKYISEPDTGIANAFNKGITLASGEYLIFLNSGDLLSENALEVMRQKIIQDNKSSLIYIGKVELIYTGGNIVAGSKTSKYKQLLRNYLPHQAMLINSSCFAKFGLYDEDYHLGMDYEWSLRLLDVWDKLSFWDDTLALMDTNGVSMSNYTDTFISYHKARKKHKVIPAFISRIFSLFFIVKRTVGIKVKKRCQ
jgi:glycosyltransferase involved in cell wall biosynthesis